MLLDSCLETAISKLAGGLANQTEKTLVLANESIGVLKNGGFLYFYGYDFRHGILRSEVIDAHAVINPEVKLLHLGFQNYLSDDFYEKNPDARRGIKS